MYRCKEIANYFLSLVDEDAGDLMTNLKLQKLLYYAQGFHLAIYGRPLFPERIEAWEYGPVVPAVYHALKKNGSGPIRLSQGHAPSRLNVQVRNLLNEIYSVYGQFSAIKLMSLTHAESPWKETRRGSIISHDAMKRYFRTRLVSK